MKNLVWGNVEVNAILAKPEKVNAGFTKPEKVNAGFTKPEKETTIHFNCNTKNNYHPRRRKSCFDSLSHWWLTVWHMFR